MIVNVRLLGVMPNKFSERRAKFSAKKLKYLKKPKIERFVTILTPTKNRRRLCSDKLPASQLRALRTITSIVIALMEIQPNSCAINCCQSTAAEYEKPDRNSVIAV